MEVESSEKILINMKTSYPTFAAFQLRGWAGELVQSSLPSSLQSCSSLSSFPSLFWARAQPGNMKFVLIGLIQSFLYARPYALFTL